MLPLFPQPRTTILLDSTNPARKRGRAGHRVTSETIPPCPVRLPYAQEFQLGVGTKSHALPRREQKVVGRREKAVRIFCNRMVHQAEENEEKGEGKKTHVLGLC